MKYHIGMAAVCIAALLAAIPVYAHHPFSAEYDSNKPITMTGMVTRIDWAGPHAQLYMDVIDDNGNTTKWMMELADPQKLQTLGWTKDSVKMRDGITINGWMARDGSNRVNLSYIVLPDGMKLDAGSSYFEGQKQKRISD